MTNKELLTKAGFQEKNTNVNEYERVLGDGFVVEATINVEDGVNFDLYKDGTFVQATTTVFASEDVAEAFKELMSLLRLFVPIVINKKATENDFIQIINLLQTIVGNG